jgi:lipopolysaccharide biosynthesis glycosyltransferase
MKNLIYQFWSGDVPYYAKASAKKIKEYSDYIGADHKVYLNDDFVKSENSHYHNCFRPILDTSFHEYDSVLFLDMDIFPVENIKENIFETDVRGIGMVEEWHQPELRYGGNGPICGRNDEEWASRLKKHYGIVLPRNEKQQLKVFNSGVVYYTKESLVNAYEKFPKLNDYQRVMQGMNRFYSLDQNYLGGMAFLETTEFTQLDNKWNSQIHFQGQGNPRPIHSNITDDTQLVHIQLRGRNTLTDQKIYDIVNKPIEKWAHR